MRLAARASEWMAKTEDVAQFLKGTPHAAVSPDFHSHSGKIQKNTKIQIVHHPLHKLSSASSVELIS